MKDLEIKSEKEMVERENGIDVRNGAIAQDSWHTSVPSALVSAAPYVVIVDGLQVRNSNGFFNIHNGSLTGARYNIGQIVSTHGNGVLHTYTLRSTSNSMSASVNSMWRAVNSGRTQWTNEYLGGNSHAFINVRRPTTHMLRCTNHNVTGLRNRTGGNVNVRRGPGTAFASIGTLANNTQVVTTHRCQVPLTVARNGANMFQVTTAATVGGWVRINSPFTGWVHQPLLT